jgi:hypothetical protein
MGYNIEITYNIFNQSNINEIQNYVIEMANEYNCKSYYIDFEMENNYDYKRNHCVITVNFDDMNSRKIIDFLKKIKIYKVCYIEAIYNDDTNDYIFASKNYLIQNTNKLFTSQYYSQKKTKKYSDIEKSILKVLENNK